MGGIPRTSLCFYLLLFFVWSERSQMVLEICKPGNMCDFKNTMQKWDRMWSRWCNGIKNTSLLQVTAKNKIIYRNQGSQRTGLSDFTLGKLYATRVALEKVG